MRILLVALLLAGCATVPQEPAKPVVVEAQSYKADWQNQLWTDVLANSIVTYGKDMKAPEGCDKVKYFTMLMSSLARFESAFKPETSYTEKFPDANGVRVVSRGLFQLSQESVNGSRYKCGIKDAKALHDAKTNIECAVKVANALIRENGVLTGSNPWKGLARYWSPFRDPAKAKVIMEKARGTCK